MCQVCQHKNLSQFEVKMYLDFLNVASKPFKLKRKSIFIMCNLSKTIPFFDVRVITMSCFYMYSVTKWIINTNGDRSQTYYINQRFRLIPQYGIYIYPYNGIPVDLIISTWSNNPEFVICKRMYAYYVIPKYPIM